MNPFVKSRPRPKREDDPRRVRGRVRLHGDERTAERERCFERSGGRCEDKADGARCTNRITLESMHWSHDRHGANKSDDAAIASCESCHRNRHNAGGKPVPKKPGRAMTKAEGLRYWQGLTCFCDGRKPRESSFCFDCKSRLSPQQRLDLEQQTNADWLQTVAGCELTILQAQA